jgi:ribonuclease Z
MTFAEAATLASDARARMLWLTHFSTALPRPVEFLPEAQRHFPGVVIGRDGLSTTLSFPD